MDDTVDRNLDTLSRRLAELESATDTALAGGVPDPLPDNDTATHVSFAELTTANDRLRTQRGWTDVDLGLHRCVHGELCSKDGKYLAVCAPNPYDLAIHLRECNPLHSSAIIRSVESALVGFACRRRPNRRGPTPRSCVLVRG
nr:hypothetical protein GCM10017611_03110 [Rhodococcus wratislaviensis]